MSQQQSPSWIPWNSVEQSPEYQSANDEQRLGALRNWEDYIVKERNDAGDWTPESLVEYRLFTAAKRRQLLGSSEERQNPAFILGEFQVDTRMAKIIFFILYF